LHNNLGYNLLLQGQPEAGAAEFRRAIEIDPRSQIAHNNLGAALAAQSHPDAAEALSEWQRASDPAVAHNNLAAVLMEQGRYTEARLELDAALQLHRDLPAALANLRLVSEKDGLPATVPAAAQPVNLPGRFASRLGKFVPGRLKSKAPAPGTQSGESILGTAQASPPEQATTGNASAAATKGGKSNY